MNDQLSPVEIAELRSILAERLPVSAADLALVLRAEKATPHVEDAARLYWAWIEQGETVTVEQGRKILAALGRTYIQLEGDLRAYVQQKSAEKRQAEQRNRREAILKAAEPARAELDKAVEAIFGSEWSRRVDAGDLQPPYEIHYEIGAVRTQIMVIGAQCAALESALQGIADVWHYPSPPSFLADAKRAFNNALARV